MSKIRIVSDGTAAGTKVFTRQGLLDTPIDDVLKIELLPIEANKLLRVQITFEQPVIDVLADLVDEATT